MMVQAIITAIMNNLPPVSLLSCLCIRAWLIINFDVIQFEAVRHHFMHFHLDSVHTEKVHSILLLMKMPLNSPFCIMHNC
jgi:hypothetical protein